MPRCHSLIPGLIKPHGLTNDPMIFLDALHLEDRRRVHDAVDKRPWRQEGTDHGRCRCGRRAFMAGDGPSMIAERASAWPVDDCGAEEAHDGAHGHRRHPCRFLQPSRADGGGRLEPAPARFHRARLCRIRLEPLGLRTHVWPQRRGQDGPPLRLRGGPQGLPVHPAALRRLDLGRLGLRRPAASGPFPGDTERFDPRVEGRRAPRVWRAAPPSLPTPCRGGHGLLRVASPGKPPRFHVRDVLGATLGFLGLGGGLGPGCLVGHLARVDAQTASRGPGAAPRRVVHWHAADDPGPMPRPWRLLPRPAWLFAQHG